MPYPTAVCIQSRFQGFLVPKFLTVPSFAILFDIFKCFQERRVKSLSNVYRLFCMVTYSTTVCISSTSVFAGSHLLDWGLMYRSVGFGKSLTFLFNRNTEIKSNTAESQNAVIWCRWFRVRYFRLVPRPNKTH